MDEKLIVSIIGFEKELLQPTTRKSLSRLNELLADDFFEYGQSGHSYTKKDVIDSLPDLPEETFILSDTRLRELSDDTVLLTYIVDREGIATQKSRSCRCSIWKRYGDNWQMIFHQGTPISID